MIGDRPLAGLASERPEQRASAFAGLSLEVGDDGVAILEFDQPGVSHNRFTPELLERLGALLVQIQAEAAEGNVVGVVLTSAKPGSFIVGADVGAIAAVRTAEEGAAAARQGQRIFQQIADLDVPSVAAINGTCLGGATEMALACTWRLAADDDVEIGLPEVNLGIFPGFGGSQRLPRLISLERALQLVVGGRPVDSGKAVRIGLLDVVVPAPLLAREARRLASGATPPPRRKGPAPEDRPWRRRLRRFLLEGNPVGRAVLFRQAARRTRASTGGHYPAPEVALDVVRRGLRMPLDEALRLEAREVGELVVSDVARNLMSIFFQRQEARRRAREGTAGPPGRVAKLGVLGAGVMGGGIAQLAAYHGVTVRLRDVDAAALDQGMEVAWKRFEERRRARKLSSRGVARGMARIHPTLGVSGFQHADLVVEAVVERLDVKHEVLAEIEAAVGDSTVLATNTSSLTVAALAGALENPERLVGLHFFNPVHKMPLVEVVRGPQSAPAAVDVAARLARDLGKVPVVVADAPGFLVNRVLMPYLDAALRMVEEGVPVAAIDAALKGFGMPMGPLRLLDEIGLDVAAHVAEELGRHRPGQHPASDLTRRLRDEGRLGRKTGRGFYVHGDGKPEPDPDLPGAPPAPGAVPDDDEIVDRCILAMLDEAVVALDAGVVASPRQADLALVLGIGFAPFRGGLFRHADARGIDVIRRRMEELGRRHDRAWASADRLEAMIREGTTFHDDGAEGREDGSGS